MFFQLLFLIQTLISCNMKNNLVPFLMAGMAFMQGLPARDISMVLSIALRFIPMVADEIERIRLSQMSRGVRLDHGGIVERLRSWISVIVPLVVVMFVRADALAEAMECRAYGTHDVCARTAEKLTNRDRTIVIVAIMLFVMLFALEISI